MGKTNGMKKEQGTWAWLIQIVIISAVFLLMYFFVPFNGLDGKVKGELILFFWCIIMWIVRPLPEWLTSTFAAFLYVTLFKEGAGSVLSGFAGGGWWLVFFAEVFGAVMLLTGLGKRIAYFILAKVGKSYLSASYATNITCTLLAAFIPSVAARGALMCPIVDNLCDRIGDKPGEKGGESLPLSNMITNTTASALFLTGTGANVIGLNMVLDATGKSLSWGGWLLATFIPMVIMIALIPWICYKLFPPKDRERAKHIDVKFAEDALKEMGPMTAKERWALGCFCLTVLLWATSSITGLNDNFIVFATAVLLLIPPFAAADSKTIINHITLAPMIWIGFAMGFAGILNNGGAFQWLVDTLFTNTAFVYNLSYTSFLIIWIVLVIFSHIIFAGINPMVTIFVPIGMAVANSLGFNPYTVGVITTICVGVGANFLPFNSMPNVLYYGLNRYTQKQELTASVLINLGVCILLILTLLVFWPMIGMV